MAQAGASVQLNGSSTANPYAELFQVSSSGAGFLVEEVDLSYLSAAAGGATAPFLVQIDFGATLAVYTNPPLMNLGVGKGDFSANKWGNYAGRFIIPPANFIWLYMSGVPAATDIAYAVIHGRNV